MAFDPPPAPETDSRTTAPPAARLRLLRWGLAALVTLLALVPALAVLRWWPGAA